MMYLALAVGFTIGVFVGVYLGLLFVWDRMDAARRLYAEAMEVDRRPVPLSDPS